MTQFSFNDLLGGQFEPSTDADWEFLRASTQNLFKPKSPIDDEKLFAGRIAQINDILDAVYEEGGHAVIFGERGVGKTSLARIVQQKVQPIFKSLRVHNTSCGSKDNFYTIWGNAFNNFEAQEGKRPADYFKEKSNPYEIYNALDDLDKGIYNIFVFDEFDRIKDMDTLVLMGDLIKHFSNHPINITIIIVGVGETLTDLFAGHESIARCCAQIKMQRMSYAECREILTDRISKIGFTLPNEVEGAIIKISQGMPGYVHLLGQLSLRSAIDRKSKKLSMDDFRSALNQVLSKTDYETRTEYYKAIASSNPDNKYKEVLLACALAKSNEMGHFYAGDVKVPYSAIRQRPMDIPNFSTNLSNLCDPERGPALIKSGVRKSFQYRFANPLLQPLTIMIGVSDGMIDFTQLPELSAI